MIKQQQKMNITDSIIMPQNKPQSTKDQIIRNSLYEELEVHTFDKLEASLNHKKQQVPRKLSLIDTFQKQSKNSVGSCKKCEAWKMWAMFHDRQMLQLQKELIIKESKMVDLIKKQKIDLIASKQKIKQLEATIEQDGIMIKKLEEQLKIINKKYEEHENQIQIKQTAKKAVKNIQIQTTPQKLIARERLQPIPLQNTQKFKNIVKTSSLTTKTEGWQNFETKKQQIIVQTTNSITKRSEIEKCLFDNQTLRDYNNTLLQRLNSGRQKRKFY